jgi:hypothetical protein
MVAGQPKRIAALASAESHGAELQLRAQELSDTGIGVTVGRRTAAYRTERKGCYQVPARAGVFLLGCWPRLHNGCRPRARPGDRRLSTWAGLAVLRFWEHEEPAAAVDAIEHAVHR